MNYLRPLKKWTMYQIEYPYQVKYIELSNQLKIAKSAKANVSFKTKQGDLVDLPSQELTIFDNISYTEWVSVQCCREFRFSYVWSKYESR